MEVEVHPSLNLLTKTQKQIGRERCSASRALTPVQDQNANTKEKKGGKMKPHTQQPTHPATSRQTAVPASTEAR